MFFGGRGENRTLTISLPLDFESNASTNSATRPKGCRDIIGNINEIVKSGIIVYNICRYLEYKMLFKRSINSAIA
jgi:hypothetical protein